MADRRSRITPLRASQVYEAVLGLLREVGYDALTMEAVAARSRAGKATLYRQWGGKPQLVIAALRHRRPLRTEAIDTGTLRGDLHALVEQAGEDKLVHDARLHLGVGGAILDNTELRRSLRESVLEPVLADMAAMLRRAVRRGEVRADCPALDLVPRTLCSLIIARLLLSDEPMDVAEARRHLDGLLLPALGIHPLALAAP
ncbi:TetR/AcrR family transcriptional regulator [Streptomyces roseirectus]|uniref:TetR/AcrR family transcriptional regulator n=1 Tax=Streptomyces roseirectus TaxID=2768066 RepID=A0A7H0I7K0_9ACTN|nr:TetR/AcrR family transcriptional regulator [Streptomyces roseirectus]QNP68766.1 TetR/AcrR family transcriptional regulator [Streptomyces roseirectus]